ncbi:hypothetical protein KBB96_05170 [Luteolibacter ambystomatis]|uniref:Teneurin-like YD-shell domain-containing protein n=1 Tax=Luteolibacter ambystomatis TaxID=2824561 RepID=A0A975PFX2_9BACT|nr:RHS repeat-associated core domain-containing protein [Luteolibacter ambystomatis]QUE52283.1 hypothetical protein KBB96_05170 [Luteolibacter ambystomatis]
MKSMQFDYASSALLALAIMTGSMGTVLAAPTVERYERDGSGNLVSISNGRSEARLEYDRSNKIVSRTEDSGVTTFEYNAAGLVVRELRNGSLFREYTYGMLDKVVKISEGDESTEFYYNAAGMLIGKQKRGGAESWAWDGYGLLMRGSVVFSNEDHISGGIPALASDAQQPLLSDYLGTSFEAESSFGKGITGVGQRFTGKPFDADLGAVVFPFRNFRSDLCRWSGPDPLGYPDGGNTYAYASCPTSSMDPTGLLDMATKVDTGTTQVVSHASGLSWNTKIWTVKTDDHSYTATLYQNLESATKPQANYNCHGYVFGGSGYWIDNPDVAGILTGDKWVLVAEADIKASKSPYIGVYNGNEHSVKVTKWVDASVQEVTGKGGVTPAPVTTTPAAGWTTGASLKYYEK